MQRFEREEGKKIMYLFSFSLFSVSVAPFAIYLDSPDPLKCTPSRSASNELTALKKLNAYVAALQNQGTES